MHDISSSDAAISTTPACIEFTALRPSPPSEMNRLHLNLAQCLPLRLCYGCCCFFFFQAEDGIRDIGVTGVQTCALPISTTSSLRRNFPDAMNGLGLMYALGRGVPQNFSEAMKWWIKAVDGGSIAALGNIATAYYRGLGGRQSYPDAAKWFHLAAVKGDADAMNALGLMYVQGSGVTRNRPKAIELFTQSAYLGCSSAMINLGTLYAVGQGVKHDNRLAYAWLGAALLSGVSAEERDAAVYALGMAAARLDPNQRARAEGLAREIAVSIVTGQARTPDRKSAQALPGSTM